MRPTTMNRGVGGVREARARLALLALAAAFAVTLTAAAGASAATPNPLVSTATSVGGGGGVVRSGTTLTATFNGTPVLASAYSLTLTDGANVGTLSSSAGNLSAAVNGNSITFDVTGAPAMTTGGSLSLGVPLEILASTGVSDGSGNPWDLVASGEVNKSMVLLPGDTVVVTFNEPVTVAPNYSLTVQEGTNSAVIDSSNSHVSGSGTSTASFTLTANLGATVAADGPNIASFSNITPTPTVQVGDTLTHDFAGVVTSATPETITLSDGSDSGTASTTVSTASDGSGGTNVTYDVTAAPTMTTGTQLFTAGLTATAAPGLAGASAPFALTTNGPGPPAPIVMSDSVTIAPGTTCSDIGLTRVFGGTNCGISHASGPIAPDVFDVIPLPTTDLPGPPDDNAPEVITNCQAGSTDYVYDVNTGALLGSNPCGNNPPEQNIGNTNSSTLDYIPTPNLVSYEEAGVVESVPGSTYVSPTSVPPQLSAITVNGHQATFSYFSPVVCQSTSSDAPTISQFTYVTPYTNLSKTGLVYPTAMSCPSSAGATSITVTYSATIPFPSGLRFKFVGYGPGHFIVGAPGSPFANMREASESAYAGPTASITSFTPHASTTATSAGGNVAISFATTGAQTCSLSAVSLPAGAAALSLPSAASCNGTAAIAVPANTSAAANVVYTVTLTATGVPGTPPTNAEITITVPAAPLPAPTNTAVPTISGTAVPGQTLTLAHGSWSSNPTGYSDQWERCDINGAHCVGISGATGQTYAVSSGDEGDTIRVLESASNASGAGTAVASAQTTLVPTPAGIGKTVSPPPPNARLVKFVIHTRRRTATFNLASDGNATGYKCALVLMPKGKHARTPKPAYVSCGASKTYRHLKLGRTYVLYVLAVGPGGVENKPLIHRFELKAAAHKK